MKLALAQAIDWTEKGLLVSLNHGVLLFLPQLGEFRMS
jgi:hypothetical protein